MKAPFRWDGDHIAADVPGGRVLFTTRRGGVSTGPYTSLNLGLWTDDQRDRVLENRERVAKHAGIPRERFAQGRQVHGTEVRVLAEPPPPGEPRPADGQVTSAGGVAPIVLVADCLPVALVADGAVGMLHCGWRGLAGGLIGEGVGAVRRAGRDTTVTAAIGPAVCGRCYEVGDDVREQFAAHREAIDGTRVDLKAVARTQLEEAGVGEIHDVGLCTMCGDPELFFSHRRDGGVTGRQAGIVWRS